MTTTTKIILRLFIMTFWACSNSSLQQNKPTSDKKTVGNYESNVSIVNGGFVIDTNAILNNNNLQLLIDDLEKNNLRENKTVTEIPPFIKSFLDTLTGSFSIANPGEDWQAGCTSPMEIDNSTQRKSINPKTRDTIITISMKTRDVPTRQLVYFGLGKKIALMTYYTGGIGKSEHILIFKFDGNKIVDFWCGNILTDIKTKAEVIKYLKENKDKEWGLNTNIIYI